jgi:hypothetical protein
MTNYSKANIKSKSNMSRRIQQESKYCKVCHDSGKPENIYKSHFIRESRVPNSRIVCPTLLSIECRYCFKKGHTIKYCPTLKNKHVPQQRQEVSEKKEKTEERRPNIYMVLEDDSDDSDEDEKEEFPQLTTPKVVKIPVTISYASIASKPKEQEKKVDIPDLDTRIHLAQEETKKYKKPLRWADDDSDSDSDSDQDQDQDEEYQSNIRIYSNVGAQMVAVEEEDW